MNVPSLGIAKTSNLQLLVLPTPTQEESGKLWKVLLQGGEFKENQGNGRPSLLQATFQEHTSRDRGKEIKKFLF